MVSRCLGAKTGDPTAENSMAALRSPRPPVDPITVSRLVRVFGKAPDEINHPSYGMEARPKLVPAYRDPLIDKWSNHQDESLDPVPSDRSESSDKKSLRTRPTASDVAVT